MRYFVIFCLVIIALNAVVYGQSPDDYVFSPQLALSGDGQILAVSGRVISDSNARSGQRFPVDIFDTINGNLLVSYLGSQDDILGLSLNFDGSLLIYNNSYGELIIVDTQTLNDISELMSGGFVDIGYAEWNPTGDTLIAYFGTVLNIYTSNPPNRANIFSDDATSEILGFDWSSDGNHVAYTSRLASGSQGVVEILNVNSPTEMSFYKRFDVPASLAVALNSDGSLVATVTTDGVLVVDITDETQTVLMNNTSGNAIVSLAWSPDSSQIAGGGKGFVNIWDVNTGQIVEIHQTPTWVNDVIWSPNGEFLYHTGGSEGIYRNGIPLALLPPTANAGPDQTLIDSDNNGSKLVTLDGSLSTDSDGTIVSYEWSEGGVVIATGVNPQVIITPKK